MNTSKPSILIFVSIILISAIYYLSVSGVNQSRPSEVVEVTPRVPVSKTEVLAEPDMPTPPPAAVSPQEKMPAPPKEIKTKAEVKKDIMPRMNIHAEDKSKQYELAKEITTPDGFINTDGKPVTVSEFVGKKIILVDFWTYSCINCQHTTPYLNAWYEKYKDQGFVIIGVHTPEFGFEKEYGNVQTAVEKAGIKFPIVLDNDYSTWNAYNNRYWPRMYLVDIDGYIVYDHAGEGAYNETEKKIQELLNERKTILGN